MHIIAVIPARYKSKRFPGKPLADICGKTMIQRVYEQATKSRILKDVIVATDDRRIFETVQSFGGRVLMTSAKCRSGTDRVAEVVRNMNADIVVNIQGDEPLLMPQLINQIVKPMLKNELIVASTAIHAIDDVKQVRDPNVVKVVPDRNNFALYFSRFPIPYSKDAAKNNIEGVYYKHIGIYAFRKTFLLEYVGWKPSMLEKREKLEQLRILEYGYKIKTVITSYDFLSVDVPRDLREVRRRIR